MDTKRLLQALCSLHHNDGGLMFGQGAFIGPYHVITAMHVLLGKQKSKIHFKNATGMTSGIDPNGPKEDVMHFAHHDLMIAKLKDPIGDARLDLAAESDQPLPLYMLLTQIDGVANVHPLLLTKITATDQHKMVTSVFACKAPIVPGCSGSPIVDVQGRIASVLSGIGVDENLNRVSLPFVGKDGIQGAPLHAVRKLIAATPGL